MRVYRRGVPRRRSWLSERGVIMATLTTAAAIVAALLILPILILLWATESPQQRARRMRAAGQSFRAIGAALGVSHTTARRYCLS